MKHERLIGIAGTLIHSAPVLALFALCAAAGVAATVEWHQTNRRQAGRAPFTLVAHPRSRTVTAGATARYWIVIDRGRYRGRISLVVASRTAKFAPRKEGGKVTLAAHRQRVLLTIKTARAALPGAYEVSLGVAGRRYRGRLMVKLEVAAPRPAPVEIAGNFGPLWPGTSQALDLALSNPNSQAIAIDRLTVSLKQVSAPRATTALPCTAADFSVRQFSGTYPLHVPADSTVHLSGLGIARSRGPQLLMLDRPVNQDGCQGATVTLSYVGTATSP